MSTMLERFAKFRRVLNGVCQTALLDYVVVPATVKHLS